MQVVHISTTKISTKRGICGEVGELTGYDPTDATCEKCIEKFKQAYPDTWDMWLRKKGK